MESQVELIRFDDRNTTRPMSIGSTVWGRFSLMAISFTLLQAIYLGGEASLLHGQGALEEARSVSESIDSRIPEGAKPDRVQVVNEAGTTIELSRVRFEELERAQLAQQEAAATVKPVLERLSLDIRLDGSIARLAGEAKAVLGQPNQTPVDIPLNLSSIQVLPPEDGSPFPIRVASDGTGFLWRIAKEEALERSLKFQALANVQLSGQAQFLRLVLPMTTCTVLLTLPPGDWDVDTSGSESEVVEPLKGDGSVSQFRIRSSGGPIDISWVSRSDSESGQATEAVCNSEFQLGDNGTEFTVLSKITLRGPKSIGGRKFLIELPINGAWDTNWTSGATLAGYKLTQLPGEEGKPPSAQVVVDETFSGFEVEPQLAWRFSSAASASQTELGNLIVSGVDLQTMTVDLKLPRSRTLLWRPQNGVAFVRRAIDSENGDWLVHSFKILDPKQSLRCNILLPVTAPAVKAEYRIWLFPDRWLLTGSLDMNDSPRTLPFLQLESQGWKIEQVTSGASGREISFMEGISETGENSTIPLNSADLVDTPQPSPSPGTPGQTDSPASRRINVRMSRLFSSSLELGANPVLANLEFNLPVLTWLDEASQEKKTWSPQSSIQLFSSTANLEPIDIQKESSGWSMDTNVVSATEQYLNEARAFNPREGKPRFHLGLIVRGINAPFMCRFKPSILEATYETTTNLRVTTTADAWKVEQDWLLQIKGLYPSKLRLAVPNNWLNSESDENLSNSIEVNINGTSVTGIAPLTSEESDLLNQRLKAYAGTSRWVELEVPAPVYASTSIDSPWLVTVNPVKPIVRSADKTERFDQLMAHLESESNRSPINYSNFSCLVLYRPEDRLLLNGKSLSKTQSVMQIGEEMWMQSRIQLSTELPRIDVTLVPLSQSVSKPVHVERQWVQTAINGSTTRHRHVIRFRTKLPSVTLEAPQGILYSTGDGISAILNGERIALDKLAAKDLTFQIDLTNVRRLATTTNAESLSTLNSVESDESIADLYVLELFTWPTTNFSLLRTVDLPNYKVAGSDLEYAPLIWQVICGTSLHLVSTSEMLSPDYRWKWSSFFFARKDEWKQADMEKEIGASPQPDLGGELNQYSLVSLDSKFPAHVTLAPRYAIWTPVALLTLMLSALAVRFDLIFKPLLWCIAIPTAIAVASWSLDLSILVVQALLLALSVMILYSGTRWILDRGARKRSVFAGRGNSASLFPSHRVDSRSDFRAEAPSGSHARSLASTVAQQPAVAPKSSEIDP